MSIRSGESVDQVTDVEAKPPKGSKGNGIDWELIEKQYRVGTRSVRQIAAEHNISHGAINKRIKRDGWVQDLKHKVLAKADEKVARASVPKVSGTQVSTVSKKSKVDTDAEPVELDVVVEAEAQLQFNVRMAHRRDINRTRCLFQMLISEVEHQSSNIDLYEQLGELLDETTTTDKGQVIVDKINQIYRKVIATPGRVDSAKKLSDVLSTVIRLEREAFGIDVSAPEKDDFETVLEKVGKKLAARRAEIQ